MFICSDFFPLCDKTANQTMAYSKLWAFDINILQILNIAHVVSVVKLGLMSRSLHSG